MGILDQLRQKLQTQRNLPEPEKLSQKQLLTNVLDERIKNKHDVVPFYVTETEVISLANINTVFRTQDTQFQITMSDGKDLSFKFDTTEECDSAFAELIHKWHEYYSKNQIVFIG